MNYTPPTPVCVGTMGHVCPMWTAVLIRELSLQIVSCSWQVQLVVVIGQFNTLSVSCSTHRRVATDLRNSLGFISGDPGLSTEVWFSRTGVRGEGWSSFGGVEIGSCLGGVGGVSGGGGVVSTAAGGDGVTL